MLTYCRKLAVLLLMWSLPLQSLHASVMPLCKQDEQTTNALQQHAHPDDAVGHQHADGAADIKLACDSCNLCQVCSAPAISSAGIDVALDPVTVPPAIRHSSFTLFIPEQPQRPPLAVLA